MHDVRSKVTKIVSGERPNVKRTIIVVRSYVREKIH